VAWRYCRFIRTVWVLLYQDTDSRYSLIAWSHWNGKLCARYNLCFDQFLSTCSLRPVCESAHKHISLSANAYGIYLVHYVFVTWVQYELLAANLSATQKGAAVFFITLLLSWGLIAFARCNPFLDRILSSGSRPVNSP
jgi:hypothetical protein